MGLPGEGGNSEGMAGAPASGSWGMSALVLRGVLVVHPAFPTEGLPGGVIHVDLKNEQQ